eukprot:3337409-Pyramimonas_sp.AAC.1
MADAISASKPIFLSGPNTSRTWHGRVARSCAQAWPVTRFRLRQNSSFSARNAHNSAAPIAVERSTARARSGGR